MFDPTTRVLVLDDMLTMRKIVAKVCRDLGFKDLTEGSDGEKGWTALCNAEKPIGLIISDWNMPECTGLELLKRVRADQRFRHLPFVLVTAETEQKQIVEALASGVSGYVTKPFTPDTLRTQLENIHKKISNAAAAAEKKSA